MKRVTYDVVGRRFAYGSIGLPVPPSPLSQHGLALLLLRRAEEARRVLITAQKEAEDQAHRQRRQPVERVRESQQRIGLCYHEITHRRPRGP